MAFGDPVQWFRAVLPELARGACDEYRVELSRAGRSVATLPVDGSWCSVIGVDATPAPETAHPPMVNDSGWPSQPRFGYELEFFAALTVNLRADVVGATPEGYRINFFFLDGRVVGPGINSVVDPEGGDWMCIRPDGIGAVHITISFRTSDGALILEHAGGVFDLGPDGYAKAAAGDFTGSPPLYATPTWSTSHPRWQWLNRCQGFGMGRVVLEKLQVQCDVYLPHVGDRIARG
jgi:hypothetical protein